MRLTTKFSAFVTLLTGLAIFVTLLGCSFSFYRAIEQKVAERVESVAAVIDTRLILQPPSALAAQLDELMVPVDIVRVVVKQGEHILLDHVRSGSYRPAGSSDLHRERLVPSIKNPGTSILLVYQDPMANYFHSVITTVPLTFAVGFMVIIIFLAVRWQRRQLAGQELLESRATRILNGERGQRVRGSIHEWPARASSALDLLLTEIHFAGEQRSR
ncbi:RNase E specificity factor CsrD, partial [Escherichia coli O8:H10]